MSAKVISRVSGLFPNITSANVLKSSKGFLVSLRIQTGSQEGNVAVPLIWFRDHCRSSHCYNHKTNQRKSNATNLFASARINNEDAIQFDAESQKLNIQWSDGHQSTFTSEELAENLIAPKRLPTEELYQLWNATTFTSMPTIPYKNLDFAAFSRTFVDFGFAIISGIEATPEATEALCREIGQLHDTFFGSFWTFSNSEEKQDAYHEDTAYSNGEIGPHVDGTYFPQSPGIQVFHCLVPAAKGGDTVLVDAFQVAEKLRKEDSKAFDKLTTTNIDHHYIEGGNAPLHSIAPARPVIELDPYGNIRQIRFNPYDRAPFSAFALTSNEKESSEKATDVLDFYSAYESFSKMCHDDQNAVKISLQPGMVIFIDNHRVLHSRTEFTGFRQLCGCYMSRDNLLAKARRHLSEEIRRLI